MKPFLPRGQWTDKEEKLCRDLIEAGLPRAYIATFIGRTEKAISMKMNNPKAVKVQSTARVNDDILRARDRRLKIKPRDLTAYICGDPLPGYSALERRA